MVLLYLLLPDWLNTRKEGEKSLSDMQGNVNLRGQPIIESLLHLSFQRLKYEHRIIIAFIKSK